MNPGNWFTAGSTLLSFLRRGAACCAPVAEVSHSKCFRLRGASERLFLSGQRPPKSSPEFRGKYTCLVIASAQTSRQYLSSSDMN